MNFYKSLGRDGPLTRLAHCSQNSYTNRAHRRTSINQSIKIYFPSSLITEKNYNVINVVALKRLEQKHYAH